MGYFIKEDYVERLNNEFADERGQTDFYQDEVYKAARVIVDQCSFTSVMDIGTGGGFKLLKYFSDKKTLGLDLPTNVDWVKSQYPDRDWRSTSLLDDAIPGFDLVMSADVIEHIPDPDELLGFITRCKPKRIIISTPNRDNCEDQTGPPRNAHHVREWSASEFFCYMNHWFDVIEHIYPGPERKPYSTMWVVAKLKE